MENLEKSCKRSWKKSWNFKSCKEYELWWRRNFAAGLGIVVIINKHEADFKRKIVFGKVHIVDK